MKTYHCLTCGKWFDSFDEVINSHQIEQIPPEYHLTVTPYVIEVAEMDIRSELDAWDATILDVLRDSKSPLNAYEVYDRLISPIGWLQPDHEATALRKLMRLEELGCVHLDRNPRYPWSPLFSYKTGLPEKEAASR